MLEVRGGKVKVIIEKYLEREPWTQVQVNCTAIIPTDEWKKIYAEGKKSDKLIKNVAKKLVENILKIQRAEWID